MDLDYLWTGHLVVRQSRMLIYHRSGIDPLNLPRTGGVHLPNSPLGNIISKSAELSLFHLINLLLKMGLVELCAGGRQDPIKMYPRANSKPILAFPCYSLPSFYKVTFACNP